MSVAHASDIGYLLGGVWLDASTSSAAKLASVMFMNYALSFAASLDPNDGRGQSREYRILTREHTKGNG